MTDKRKNQLKNIDSFLKKALPDDCPSEVERQLLDMVDNLKIEAGTLKGSFLKNSGKTLQQGLGRILKPLRTNPMVLGFLSITLFLLGSIIQFSGGHSILAEDITALKTADMVIRHIGQADDMQCHATAQTRQGKRVSYRIAWHPEGKTVVQILDSDKNTLKTAKIDEKRAEIQDFFTKSSYMLNYEQLKTDPLFGPVYNILSSSALTRLIRGHWQIQEYRRQNQVLWGTFSVQKTGISADVKLTIDMQRMEINKMELNEEENERINRLTVDFNWNSRMGENSNNKESLK